MIRRPPRSTLFPTRRSSDLVRVTENEPIPAMDLPVEKCLRTLARILLQSICGTCHRDRKSTRLNSSHSQISYAVFCLKKKKKITQHNLVITSSIKMRHYNVP